ncbi:MAG: type II secretion system F family protein [Patescibacteria group bacterium]
MKLDYKAKDEAGQDYTGVVEAKDKYELARQLRTEGKILVSARPAKGAGVKFWDRWLEPTLGIKDQILLASNLSAMLSAGLSLTRSLEVIKRQSKSQTLVRILEAVIERINSGDSLSKALKAFPSAFPPVFISMVAVGEESGGLPESLQAIADQLSKNYNLRRQVKGAMIYPAIIICAIVVVGALMMIFLVPNLTMMFEELEAELPISTQIVMAISSWLAAFWLPLLGILLILVLGVVVGLRQPVGKKILSWLLLHIPFISGLTRKVNSAVVLRTTGSLITSGVSMIETLKITEQVIQNYYYKEALQEAKKRVQTGETLSGVFRDYEHLFLPLASELTEVGEETGRLPAMLTRGADWFESEVDQVTKNLSTVIEPVLMVVIGVAVGFFALSMIGPMYSLTEAI